MTANEVLQAALAQIPADGVYADYSPYTVRWVNAMLAECLAAENSIRISEGEEPLAAPPRITAATDTVPYHDMIAGYAMPRGMAALIARDMDNPVLSNELRVLYVSALAESAKFNSFPIEDVY